jgi:hypothetical protein
VIRGADGAPIGARPRLESAGIVVAVNAKIEVEIVFSLVARIPKLIDVV